MMLLRFLSPLLAIAAAPVAFAGDADPIAKTAHGLPGVAVDRPEPLPEPHAAPVGDPSSPTRFRIGDWDVRISGSVSYTIGFGGNPFEPDGTRR